MSNYFLWLINENFLFRNQELQQLFEERPSRPEDIEMIKMLQAELYKKDEEINQVM
jgi:hypothetical protein